MKVKTWSKNFVVNHEATTRTTTSKLSTARFSSQSRMGKTPKASKPRWSSGLASMSKALYLTPRKVVKKYQSQKMSKQRSESPVLLPLKLTHDETTERFSYLRHRSHTVYDRAELRNILMERFRQKIFEKSMAAVIMEAERELYMESHITESVYVNIYRENQLDTIENSNRVIVPLAKEEDDAYMTMT